jgi:hypothetical protein
MCYAYAQVLQAAAGLVLPASRFQTCLVSCGVSICLSTGGRLQHCATSTGAALESPIATNYLTLVRLKKSRKPPIRLQTIISQLAVSAGPAIVCNARRPCWPSHSMQCTTVVRVVRTEVGTACGSWSSHHHHQITKLSHSINAIGPAPHRSGRKRHVHCWQHILSLQNTRVMIDDNSLSRLQQDAQSRCCCTKVATISLQSMCMPSHCCT